MGACLRLRKPTICFSFLHALSCLVIARPAPPGGSAEGPASAASLAALLFRLGADGLRLRLGFARLRNLFLMDADPLFIRFSRALSR